MKQLCAFLLVLCLLLITAAVVSADPAPGDPSGETTTVPVSTSTPPAETTVPATTAAPVTTPEPTSVPDTAEPPAGELVVHTETEDTSVPIDPEGYTGPIATAAPEPVTAPVTSDTASDTVTGDHPGQDEEGKLINGSGESETSAEPAPTEPVTQEAEQIVNRPASDVLMAFGIAAGAAAAITAVLFLYRKIRF